MRKVIAVVVSAFAMMAVGSGVAMAHEGGHGPRIGIDNDRYYSYDYRYHQNVRQNNTQGSILSGINILSQNDHRNTNSGILAGILG